MLLNGWNRDVRYTKIFALAIGIGASAYAYQELQSDHQHTDLYAGNAEVTDNIALSNRLSYMGYDIGACGANGQYDLALENAVKHFQGLHDLKTSGVYDAETADILEDRFKETQDLKSKFNHGNYDDLIEAQDKVRDHQLALMVLGYDLSPCYASGDVNSETSKAITKFQAANDIHPLTGAFDAQTKNEIWQLVDEVSEGYQGADLMKSYAGQTVTENPLSQKLFLAMRLQTLEAEAERLKKRLPEFVVNSMAEASLESGWDLSYLGKLVSTESSGKAWAEAQDGCPKDKICTATGLYQFTKGTWLDAFKKHGGKIGYADLIKRAKTDDKAKAYMLDLRKDPKVSSLILVEWTRDNFNALKKHFGSRVGKTETYMAHFLGVGSETKGAIKFLKAYQETPDANAAELFPDAAASNLSVFYVNKDKDKPRTVEEVYNVFAKKMAPKGNNVLSITAQMANNVANKIQRHLNM